MRVCVCVCVHMSVAGMVLGYVFRARPCRHNPAHSEHTTPPAMLRPCVQSDAGGAANTCMHTTCMHIYAGATQGSVQLKKIECGADVAVTASTMGK